MTYESFYESTYVSKTTVDKRVKPRVGERPDNIHNDHDDEVIVHSHYIGLRGGVILPIRDNVVNGYFCTIDSSAGLGDLHQYTTSNRKSRTRHIRTNVLSRCHHRQASSPRCRIRTRASRLLRIVRSAARLAPDVRRRGMSGGRGLVPPLVVRGRRGAAAGRRGAKARGHGGGGIGGVGRGCGRGARTRLRWHPQIIVEWQ